MKKKNNNEPTILTIYTLAWSIGMRDYGSELSGKFIGNVMQCEEFKNSLRAVAATVEPLWASASSKVHTKRSVYKSIAQQEQELIAAKAAEQASAKSLITEPKEHNTYIRNAYKEYKDNK